MLAYKGNLEIGSKENYSVRKIVTLLPSATEIVCAIGGKQSLVGRSHECDFPSSVSNLPICTKARISSSGESKDIDRGVKALLSEALSIYEVDVTRLEGIKPDLIVTQDQCEVCAVSRTELETAITGTLTQSTRMVSLTANDIAGIWEDIKKTAEAMGLTANGLEIVRGLTQRLDTLKTKTSKIKQRPRVTCIEWISPLMVAGNWVPELVSVGGGTNLFGTTGNHSPYLSWETLIDADPDVIIAMPCGFDLSRTRTEMAPLLSLPDWPNLSAVRSDAVYVTDGNQFFNRPGPRIVESAEIIAEILHPEYFEFGHRGIGWEKLGTN